MTTPRPSPSSLPTCLLPACPGLWRLSRSLPNPTPLWLVIRTRFTASPLVPGHWQLLAGLDEYLAVPRFAFGSGEQLTRDDLQELADNEAIAVANRELENNPHEEN